MLSIVYYLYLLDQIPQYVLHFKIFMFINSIKENTCIICFYKNDVYKYIKKNS